MLIKLKNIKGLDLLILQIKNYSWLGKKLTQNIDWEAYSLYKSLKNENILLKNENALLKEKFDSIENENALLNVKVNNLFEIVKKNLFRK